VKNGKEWCPFLEEDIDASIREYAWRCSRTLWSSHLRDGCCVALDVQKCFCVESRKRLSTFLDPTLESIYSALAAACHKGNRRLIFLPRKALPLDAPMKYESEFAAPSNNGDACTRNTSSFGGVCAASLRISEEGVLVDVAIDGRRFERIFDSISIFSSFSSNKSFNSLTSPSKDRTLSSNDSVYPLGKALRLSLSLVLHSNPTFAHCEQHGRIPSHRIFLLLQRSQAWAIRLCELDPTLITFIGSIPGIILAVIIYGRLLCSLVAGPPRHSSLSRFRISRIVHLFPFNS
jgi:hypothetical protein